MQKTKTKKKQFVLVLIKHADFFFGFHLFLFFIYYEYYFFFIYLLVQVRDGMRGVMHVPWTAALLFCLTFRATRTAPTHQAKHMHYIVFFFFL